MYTHAQLSSTGRGCHIGKKSKRCCCTVAAYPLRAACGSWEKKITGSSVVKNEKKNDSSWFT